MQGFVWLVAGLLVGVLARLTRDVALPGLPLERWLGRAIIYVTLPATVLLSMHGLSAASPAPVLMAWLVLGAGAVVFVAASKLTRISRATLGALVLVCGLGNTSFVGYPVIELLYGREGLAVAVLNDQPGSFLALSTVGVLVAALCSGRRPGAGSVAWRVVSFPPFVAMAVGLASRGAALPAWLESVLELARAPLVALALVAVGMQLARPSRAQLARYRVPLALGLVYKLVLAPALVFGVYRGLLESNDLVFKVSVLEAGMGPMLTAAVVAAEYGLESELAGLLVGVGVPLSALTLPLWAWLVKTV